MAVFEYAEGDHPAGFVGLRVATTLGLNDEYRQAYFSYSDYSPGQARELANALNEQWRQQALAQRQANWLSRRNARSGLGWLATGLRADILRENKFRAGEQRMYFAPAFVVDRWPRDSEATHREFRVNVPSGITLEWGFHEAVRQYIDARQLGTQEHAELLSRQPSPTLFVRLAIELGLKDYAIDINAIRRRVGLPEL